MRNLIVIYKTGKPARKQIGAGWGNAVSFQVSGINGTEGVFYGMVCPVEWKN